MGIAACYSNIGSVHYNLNNYELAMTCYTESLEITVPALGLNHLNTSILHNNIGSVHNGKREYDKALEYAQIAFEIKEKLTEPLATNYTAIIYKNMEIVYDNKGEHETSLQYHKLHKEVEQKFPEMGIIASSLTFESYFTINEFIKHKMKFKK